MPTHEDNGHRAAFWDEYFGDAPPRNRSRWTDSTGGARSAVNPGQRAQRTVQRPPRRGYGELEPGRARLQSVYVAVLVMAGIIALLIELTGGT
jgi:hypothetical protein